MISKLKKYLGNEILVAIASLVVGVMVGPILEKILYSTYDTPTRAILTSIFLLSIIVAIAIIILSKVHSDLSNVSQKLGLTVRFLPTGTGTGEVYRTAQRIIKDARKGIVFLHHVRNKGGREHHASLSKESKNKRTSYIDSILTKAQEYKKEGFFYRRIYQLPDVENTQINEQLIGSDWLNHTKAILELLKDHQDAAAIKKIGDIF